MEKIKKKYYHNDKHEHRFAPDEVIPDGWVPGRLKGNNTTGGKHWATNGVEGKFFTEDSLPEGWWWARPKEHFNPEKQSQTMLSKNFKHYTDGENDFYICEGDSIPDNLQKGRPPMKQEQKDKLSESHKGLHHTEATKLKISEHSNNNREKAFNTIVYKFGSLEEFYKYIHTKGEETKSQRKTFNSSKPEEELYVNLCKTYGKKNVLRNYKCDRYPFRCDFYIKSEDLFIELNAHWTHGPEPYDSKNEEHQKLLEEWREKAKTSQFYANAIMTWTERDVEKLSAAKDNNLNYKIIY